MAGAASAYEKELCKRNPTVHTSYNGWLVQLVTCCVAGQHGGYIFSCWRGRPLDPEGVTYGTRTWPSMHTGSQCELTEGAEEAGTAGMVEEHAMLN